MKSSSSLNAIRRLASVTTPIRKPPSISSSLVAAALSRSITSSSRQYQQQQHYEPVNPHRNFYKTHGRALFKSLTLAFFSYQVFYWAWLTLETEEMKDTKTREIKSLEGEVRLLDEGRRSHRPGRVVEEQEDQNLLEVGRSKG